MGRNPSWEKGKKGRECLTLRSEKTSLSGTSKVRFFQEERPKRHTPLWGKLYLEKEGGGGEPSASKLQRASKVFLLRKGGRGKIVRKSCLSKIEKKTIRLYDG